MPDIPGGDQDDPVQPSHVEDTHGPIVPYHWAEGICVSTVDALQGQDKDFVIFINTVTGKTGPKFLANTDRLRVAYTRIRQGHLVVGDLLTSKFKGDRVGKPVEELADDGQRMNTKEFRAVWNYFPLNGRAIYMP